MIERWEGRDEEEERAERSARSDSGPDYRGLVPPPDLEDHAVGRGEAPEAPEVAASAEEMAPERRERMYSGLGGNDGIGMPSDGDDRAIREVPLAAIELRDSAVEGPDDFRKVSYESMVRGMERYDAVVRPMVAEGATGDTFSELDEGKGLAYPDGYRVAYDAFHGQDPVKLEWVGDKYDVINGYHRIFVAQQLGWRTIPARV
jgi:hypothetical protein